MTEQPDRQARIAVGFDIARALGTPEGRDAFDRYGDGTPIRVEDYMGEPAWIRHLPPEDRAEMAAEMAALAGVDRTVALAAWHGTALVYADPELVAALSDQGDDTDPIELDVTEEQRTRWEAAAQARGQSLEAFVAAACEAAAGNDEDRAYEQAMRGRKRGGAED